MSVFKEISPYELEGNYFKKIGNEWMLITAMKPDGSFNTMTASWGGTGVYWSKPSFVCLVRPQRYTYEFTESSDIITVSFFGGEHKTELSYLGHNSGRDGDKLAHVGFHPICDGDAVYYEEATTVLVGRKMYTDLFKEDCFVDPQIAKTNYSGDFHRFYICEIVRALEKK